MKSKPSCAMNRMYSSVDQTTNEKSNDRFWNGVASTIVIIFYPAETQSRKIIIKIIIAVLCLVQLGSAIGQSKPPSPGYHLVKEFIVSVNYGKSMPYFGIKSSLQALTNKATSYALCGCDPEGCFIISTPVSCKKPDVV